MNLKRSMTYILVVMMSVNAFSMMLYSIPEFQNTPVGLQPAWNQTQIEQNLDANASLADYAWSTTVFNDFVWSTLTFLGVLWGLVTGFPNLLVAAGVPTFITDPLYGVWLLVTFIAVTVGFIGGQDT